MNDDRESFLASSFTYFQKIVKESGPAAAASYGLIGSVIVLGVIGYFLDGWLATAPWLMLAGFFIGLVAGFYGLAKTIWK